MKTEFAKWRQQVGLTQAEAASALGVALSTIKQYEGGTHRSTGQAATPPEPVRKVMRAVALGLRLDPWPE